MSELASILHEKVLKPHLGSTSRYDALQELLDLLVYSHDLSTSKLAAAREAAFRAERSRGSSCSSGAAVAHAFLEGLQTPIGALGLSKEGIDFGSDLPARVVLLLLLPNGFDLGKLPLMHRLAQERPIVIDLTEAETARSLHKKLVELEA
jgi:mannitol/fructose-specific phosphotransferase system IIA component (Ntr-type)